MIDKISLIKLDVLTKCYYNIYLKLSIIKIATLNILYKLLMGFQPKISEMAFIKCNRHCCLCHKFCGSKMEAHHIIQTADGGDDSFDNCIPLCFDCHADVKSYNPRHPKGHAYTSSELKAHRNNWYVFCEAKQKNIVNIEGQENQKTDRKIIYTVNDLCEKWVCNKHEIIYHMKNGLCWYYDNNYDKIYKNDEFDPFFALFLSILIFDKIGTLKIDNNKKSEFITKDETVEIKYNNVEIEKVTFHIDHILEYENKHINIDKKKS